MPLLKRPFKKNRTPEIKKKRPILPSKAAFENCRCQGETVKKKADSNETYSPNDSGKVIFFPKMVALNKKRSNISLTKK